MQQAKARQGANPGRELRLEEGQGRVRRGEWIDGKEELSKAEGEG